MNVYALIILLTLIAGYILDLYINLLNLKCLQTGLPQEFKDIYDAERYGKSQTVYQG